MMTLEEAKKIVGKNTGIPLKNMHMALSMCRWHNTAEEERRLEAACKILRKKYQPKEINLAAMQELGWVK
jgi:hypothetical protein